MSDALYALGMLAPDSVLIYGDAHACAVAGWRAAADGDAVIDLADGRAITVSEEQIWTGIYVSDDLVQVFCSDEHGMQTRARLHVQMRRGSRAH